MSGCSSILIGLLLLAFSSLQAAVNIEAARSDDAHVPCQEQRVGIPFFTSLVFPVYQDEMILSYSNTNDGRQTEIYISRSPDDRFTLAQIAPPGDKAYPQMKISGNPETDVRIQATDQYAYKASLIHQGNWTVKHLKKSVDAISRSHGNYIMLISVDDQINTKRFNFK